VPIEATSSIISKCARILDALATVQGQLCLNEISIKTGTRKGSTRRLMSILAHEGLVEFEVKAKQYRLGKRVQNWAMALLRSADLQKIAWPIMMALHEQTGHNASLAVLHGTRVMYVRKIERHLPAQIPRVGTIADAHSTAAGKALVAFLPDHIRIQTFGSLTFTRHNENTIDNTQVYENELRQVRADGFSTSSGEQLSHVHGLGVPIFDHQERVVAAITLWDLESELDVRSCRETIELLCQSAREISKQMGNMPSPP